MNLLLIVSDTLRWDYLGAYGNTWIETPNLDKLASESLLFLDAYAEGLPTLPARRVIKTGRHVFPFGYRPQPSDDVQLEGWHPLYDEDITLAEHLQSHGYICCYTTDVYHVMKPSKNYHRGYDSWHWIRGQEGDSYKLSDPRQVEDALRQTLYDAEPLSDNPWIVQHLMNRREWQTEADTSVAQVMAQASKWLDEYTLDNPFFMYVDCFDPHEPWDPPADYAKRYRPGYSGLDGCIPPDLTADMTPQQLENAKAAYAGEVTLVDTWIGKLLQSVERKGVLDDTAIVFTSDHGCMLGEQGELHKGADRLRNQCTRLPLLVRHPKGEAAGRTARGFVQHQDIMPTALSLLGLDIPGRVLGRNVWAPVGEVPGAPDHIVTGFGDHASIRTHKWNYIQPWKQPREGTTGRYELYDLERDPQELVNVLDDNKKVGEELAARLEAHIKLLQPLVDGSFQSVADAHDGMSFDALPSL